jgi:hypothetical protein
VGVVSVVGPTPSSMQPGVSVIAYAATKRTVQSNTQAQQKQKFDDSADTQIGDGIGVRGQSKLTNVCGGEISLSFSLRSLLAARCLQRRRCDIRSGVNVMPVAADVAGPPLFPRNERRKGGLWEHCGGLG